MTEIILGPDGKPAPEPEQKIEVDAYGDPIRQGSLMEERQSLERVIDGLRMVTDACAHLIHYEPLSSQTWCGFILRFDQIRREIAHKSGDLTLAMNQKETPQVKATNIPWRECRDRFLDGMAQAAGGARQMATCHRGDLWWSLKAKEFEAMAEALRHCRRQAMRRESRRLLPKSLILPGYH